MDVPSALHKPREEERPARPTELMEAVGQSAPMLRPVPDLPPEPPHARGRERDVEGRGPSRGYKLPEDQRPSRPDSQLWDDTLHGRQTAPPPSASFKGGTPPGAEPPFRDEAPRWSESPFSSEPPADNDVPPRREKPSKAEKAPKGEKPPKTEKPAKAKAEKAPKPDADKPWYERAGLVVEKVPKGESPKGEKLSKKDAAALASLESLNRDLRFGSGGPPIQRPLNSPASLEIPAPTPPPMSMTQWSKSFQPPAAWTEPIAMSYVQKRAMLETMKGAKGDQKDAKTPKGTTPNTSTGTMSQANQPGTRFGAARKPADVSPPPPVVRSTPVSSSSSPRFSAPYNYPTAGGTKSYPTISSRSSEHTWTPATGASTLNPYFRQYAKYKVDEPSAVPYWQRKLDNPTASQQIRMINQNWIAARQPEPTDPSPSQRDMLDGNVEEPPPEDPMAAAPTSIWLPKLPKLPEPQEIPDLPPAGSPEPEGLQGEASDVVDLTEFQSRREHERDASDSYASADKWVSLKDFDVQPEPDRYEGRESNEPSAEDLDWESLVRKPKKSRRRRRKEAEQWEPPPAELEFRDREPRSRERERFLEPEPRERREAEPRYRDRDEPELRYRRREEPEPGYSEPEYEVREPRHREPEPRHREPEYEVREPRHREPEHEVREPRHREPEPRHREPEYEVREPRHREETERREPAISSRVKASRDAMLVEDGLVYVLVDDEGRPVLQ